MAGSIVIKEEVASTGVGGGPVVDGGPAWCQSHALKLAGVQEESALRLVVGGAKLVCARLY